MSIKTFLSKTLQNIKNAESANPDDTIAKLEDETVYLTGAAEALKAVGATSEAGLTDKTLGLFKQKIALIESHQKLLNDIENFDDTPAAE